MANDDDDSKPGVHKTSGFVEIRLSEETIPFQVPTTPPLEAIALVAGFLSQVPGGYIALDLNSNVEADGTGGTPHGRFVLTLTPDEP